MFPTSFSNPQNPIWTAWMTALQKRGEKKKYWWKRGKWEWLNWNRSVVERRWISVLSVESCHNSPQQLFWEQLGVAGNMSHTPLLLLYRPRQESHLTVSHFHLIVVKANQQRGGRAQRSRGAGGGSFNLVAEESFKPPSYWGGGEQREAAQLCVRCLLSQHLHQISSDDERLCNGYEHMPPFARTGARKPLCS